MIERNEISSDQDATLVRPLFDEEATETARPVVPLAANIAASATSALSGGAYSTSKRRSWPWALVVVSVIAGSVIGVVGLSFYQKRRIDSASTATQVEPQSAAPEFSPSQPGPSPNVATVDTVELPSVIPAREDKVIDGAEGVADPAPTLTPARRAEREAEAARSTKITDETRNRAASDDDDEDDTVRTTRERAGQNTDDEPEQGATRPRRAGNVEQETRTDDQPNAEDDPGPRRVDRVRDIFTGSQPGRENRRRRRERLERRGERLPDDIP
ncbi:MAG TPA: hypothetical protein VM866_04280 [Pyrinomonadaceae bacterium]|jgi:hypothetical protein|nr:hypothetical protein [Pyrinomonadaceae bacterium]